jgi:hypothetical protein
MNNLSKNGSGFGDVGYDMDADFQSVANGGEQGAYGRSRDNSDDVAFRGRGNRAYTSSGEGPLEAMARQAQHMQKTGELEPFTRYNTDYSDMDTDGGGVLSDTGMPTPPKLVTVGDKRETFSIKVSTGKGSLVGEVTGDNLIELANRRGIDGENSSDDSEGGGQARKYVDIFPVPDDEILHKGDIVFFMTSNGQALKKLYDKEVMKGLRIMDASVFDLAGFGTELVELVLSRKNKFLGKHISNSGFGKYYGGSVVAVRNVGHKTEMAKGHLHAGDMVMLVMSEEKLEILQSSFGKEFYVITRVGSIPPPVEVWDYGGVLLFVTMLICLIVVPKAAASEVQIIMTTMMLMIGGTWVKADEALGAVDFPLLGLIGSALGLAKSVDKSGLAAAIASFIKNTDMSPLGAMYVVTMLSMLLTNVVTNNAAAALAVPIALSIADALEVSYKPFIMAVLYAASISFMTPIGYQTNTMIWGPGGYTFTDFMKIGIPLNILYLVLACALLPLVFPF